MITFVPRHNRSGYLSKEDVREAFVEALEIDRQKQEAEAFRKQQEEERRLREQMEATTLALGLRFQKERSDNETTK